MSIIIHRCPCINEEEFEDGDDVIGYYSYTVILTFMSLISALVGISLSINGHFFGAIVCLALSGFFDMLDGPVARTKTDRSADEQLYGIQLDSLCDLVAFGVLPAIICFNVGVTHSIGFIALVYYVTCGVVRLCYFNVRETNNFFSEEEHEKVFIGLPITSIAVIFPLISPLSLILTESAFCILLVIMLLLVGTLFIANFEIRKPNMRTLIILCLVVFAAIALFFVFEYSTFNFLSI